MIERHVTFAVLPGKECEFERFFAIEYAPAMSKQPGFHGVALVRRLESSSEYQMVIRFDCVESAAAWRASREHRSLSSPLKAISPDSQVEVYEVIADHR